MQTLITPTQVVALAFSGEELMSKDIVTQSDIIEAEAHHIRPILGDALVDKLHAGEYSALLNDYVAVALAAWCRYTVEPLLDVRCDACHRDSRRTTADNEHHAAVMRSLRRKAVTLSHRLSDHLNAHAGDYPEYNPKSNPLNYCSIYGDIIQVR